MILEMFPSYKDKEIVNALCLYERDKKVSLRLLVEGYLYSLLTGSGYLTANLDNEKTDVLTREINFSTKKQNGSVRLFCGDLDFSSHNPKHIDEIITKLKNFSYPELENLSANCWDGSKHSYKSFLYLKLNLISLLLKNDTQFIAYDKNKKVYRVKKNPFNFGSYSTLKKAKEVRDFLVRKNWDEYYSSKKQGLKGNPYRKWIDLEMEKEKDLVENDSNDWF